MCEVGGGGGAKDMLYLHVVKRNLILRLPFVGSKGNLIKN